MSKDPSTLVTIDTKLGAIRGCREQTVYDDSYYSFEGIPYAQPPLGELRFRAPVPVAPWGPEPLDCTKKPPKPLQKNPLTNEIEGSEDCLYLNVYMTKLKQKPLPVMVYLFGGGFEKGDPTRDLHGPDYFMMKDVLLVTIAYRLGPLGFLSLGDPKCATPGNAGLKDQLLGLKWVKDNIECFNGDPNNITLFGESAGAASVHFQMLTPLAEGLFHKAILMSGTVLCPWAISPLPNLAERLARASGFADSQPASDDALLIFLQGLPAEDLLRPYLPTREENLDDCLFTFGPVVEPYESDQCIIPKAPLEMLADAWSNSIPVMLGGTSFEGLLMFARVQVAPFLVNELAENAEHLLPLDLKRRHDLDKQRQLAARVRAAHFGDKEVCMENVLHYCDYASHKIFWHPILRTTKARLRHAKAPTFLYRFDFDSPDFNHQRIKYCGRDIRGVSHVDDLSYIFFGNFAWKLAPQTAEFRTILRMIDLWTAFALNSHPQCEQLASAAAHWPPLHPEGQRLQCFNIGADLQLIDLPELDKLRVWDSLYEEDA